MKERVLEVFQVELNTKRMTLRSITCDDAEIVLDYISRNRKFLSEWEPFKDQEFYKIGNVKKMIIAQENEMLINKSWYFYAFLKENGRLIGNINITNIVLGPFLSCYLGYKLDYECINKGYMTEAVKEIIHFCFNVLKLHRIEANVIPRNIPSKRVLEKLNFESEGISKKYLKINNKWEDHEHYVLLNSAIE